MMDGMLLKSLREERGLSLEAVGRAIGADRQTVWKWETGRRKISPYYRQKLEEFFEEDMKRRAALKMIGATAVGGAVMTLGGSDLYAIGRLALKGGWTELDRDMKTVENAISSLLPKLTGEALSGSDEAAALAVEACLLRATIAKHALDYRASVYYRGEAVTLSQFTSDSMLRAAALAYKACWLVQGNIRRPQEAINIYKNALHFVGESPSLMYSDILGEMAEAYAMLQDEENAMRCIERSAQTYPKRPELDPAYTYGDYPPSLLWQWYAKVHMHLGNFRQAEEALRKSEQSAPTRRGECENAILRAACAAGTNDLDTFVYNMKIGVRLAQELKSEHRKQLAKDVVASAPDRWLSEKQVQEVKELL
ncbi:DNA-binding XRE family transcriptional regulator [Thermosporothrix hazakensis]|uniref:DNA-binding XRE family transcriptional regulator n=2 Tax=Thermosporothrix TaxID=768650 RepID=A0A326U9B0_THEHA|nr:helix-turn-helix transcriptional regulator [Thermosporothrix hazakensis]PZW28456.1 DNA-binding XRE family transcriptional regulator [Thermosporothrix hazakensis]BBH86351.1 hypothetical protein KTC_11020 [Thermosporothrix sp. COM3]GCE45234.1 hypothetical protein KTH_01030 [Thermosporothrix hazakensis]